LTALLAGSAVMPVPDVDVEAARTTAERLRRVSRLGGQAGARLGTTAPHGWSGAASEAYYGQRGRAAERADVLAGFARSVSSGLDRYADSVDGALSGMRRCAEDLDIVLSHKASALADPSPAVQQAAQAEVDDVWSRYEAHRRKYDLAVLDLTDLLGAVPDFEGRHRDFWDHVSDAGRVFVERGLVEPATALGQMAGAIWDDPGSTDDLVKGLVAGWLQQLRHPVATTKDSVGWEYWQDGEYGNGVGAAMSVVGGPLIRQALRRIDAPEHFERNVADPKAPRPRIQTVDEMLAGVDLEAHEHYYLGHTIRRHVDVDDEYLIDRLENGTLLDPVKRGGKPPVASQWTDLETAELEITALLKANERQVRQFAQRGKAASLTLQGPCSAICGTSLYPRIDGVYPRSTASQLTVVLTRKDGQVLIKTAYPGKASS
jgi:Bacterial CdiA-CT RNAse A domain